MTWSKASCYSPHFLGDTQENISQLAQMSELPRGLLKKKCKCPGSLPQLLNQMLQEEAPNGYSF